MCLFSSIVLREILGAVTQWVHMGVDQNKVVVGVDKNRVVPVQALRLKTAAQFFYLIYSLSSGLFKATEFPLLFLSLS